MGIWDMASGKVERYGGAQFLQRLIASSVELGRMRMAFLGNHSTKVYNSVQAE